MKIFDKFKKSVLYDGRLVVANFKVIRIDKKIIEDFGDLHWFLETLVDSGQCISGVIHAYPPDKYKSQKQICPIREFDCV